MIDDNWKQNEALFHIGEKIFVMLPRPNDESCIYLAMVEGYYCYGYHVKILDVLNHEKNDWHGATQFHFSWIERTPFENEKEIQFYIDGLEKPEEYNTILRTQIETIGFTKHGVLFT